MLEAAEQHQLDQSAMMAAFLRIVAVFWSKVDLGDLDGSWAVLRSQLLLRFSQYQGAAALAAIEYMDAVIAEQALEAPAEAEILTGALLGYASDGRSMATLLDSPTIAVKRALASGVKPAEAMPRGLSLLKTIAVTQLADTGRVTEQISMATRPKIQGYVRVVSSSPCKRCVILAGRFYKWNAGFLRHPGCRCNNVPTDRATGEQLALDPAKLIASGNVNGLSKADTKAIDHGADVYQVVNAARGRKTGLTTTEGTTKRGVAGQLLQGRQRLTPAGIFRIASDRPEALKLLKVHGYIR